jgi:hypothetical protein
MQRIAVGAAGFRAVGASAFGIQSGCDELIDVGFLPAGQCLFIHRSVPHYQRLLKSS